MLQNQWHINPGERVVLVYPFGLEFIAAFFGCMLAGVVAVPVFPPEPQSLAAGLKRIFDVMANCNSSTILCVNVMSWGKTMWWLQTRGQVSWPARLDWRPTDTISIDSQRQWLYPPLLEKAHDLNHLVFLQYTSGSTSSPKGEPEQVVQVLLHFADLVLSSPLFCRCHDSCISTASQSAANSKTYCHTG